MVMFLKIYLTDDTIEKNIAFGCFENEINKDKIKSCLKLSQLDGCRNINLNPKPLLEKRVQTFRRPDSENWNCKSAI